MKENRKFSKIFPKHTICLYLSFVSYFISLLLLVLLFALSSYTEEKKIEINLPVFASLLVSVSIGVVLIVLSLIFALTRYFKKPKEIKEEKVLSDYAFEIKDNKAKDYSANFFSVIHKSKKDLLFLLLHSLYFPLYSLIVYFQPTFKNQHNYFLLILILGIVLFVFFLLYLFIVPFNEMRNDKQSKDYIIRESDITIVIDDKEVIAKDDSFIYARETKKSYLFVSGKDTDDIIIEKDKVTDSEAIKKLEEKISKITH